jgi:hypothetical protein
MFPNADDCPSDPRKLSFGCPISALICLDLFPPPIGIVFRPSPVLGATVPEAPIHKNRDMCGGEDDVRPCSHSGGHRRINAEAQPSAVETRPDRELLRRVSLARRNHSLPNRLRRRGGRLAHAAAISS